MPQTRQGVRKITRITNTSTHPTDEVKRLVRFALDECEAFAVEVHVKGTRHAFRGMAYRGVPGEANALRSTRYLMTVGIGVDAKFPQAIDYWKLAGGGPNGGHVLADWREALVYLAAHEGRHLSQFEHARTWGKGRGEVDCERHAMRMLRRYREELCT
jgi:hypothetical protein